MKIGAQLFTVRRYTETLDAFAETLARVADIGFSTVQVSATCPYEGAWLDEQLKKNGLTCPVTHYDFSRVMTDTDAVIAEHRKFGAKAIGLGSMIDPELFRAHGAEAGRKIADAGMYLLYHNHDKDYFKKEDGTVPLYELEAGCPARELGFLLDIFWAEAAGYPAVGELRRFAGRMPYIHLKDGILPDGGEHHFTPIGEGTLDWETILAEAENVGVEAAFVEQDACYDDDPMDCLKRSFDYLHALGAC